ncbi:MAG: PP2C family protein-serine/threonine phosphatase [Vicinamibacteria bacterium]
MRLRTQLALAFLLLAVLPPAAMTLYSFTASRRAFREAADAEGQRLAGELRGRLERAAAALSSHIARLQSRSAGGRDSAFEKARREAIEQAQQGELARLLAPILSEGRSGEGNIPFARDRSGRLYTADLGDQPTLYGLGLAAAPADAAEARVDPDDWLVVAREDPASGLTVGVAHPLGRALREVRRTAVRNLGYGLAMVALALLGVIPLSRRLTRHLATLTDAAERVGRGETGVSVPLPHGAELRRLAATFNRMSDDLRRNQERLLEQERLRKELEISRRIQQELLPREAGRFGFAEVAGLSVPAREVGGDFFNYFPLGGREAAILVGDVSGKGVPAALLMANLQATLRARLQLERDLAALVERLDRELESTQTRSLYLTLFVAVVDTAARELRYVNAGHNTQLLLRAAGDALTLPSSGRPPGLFPGGGYEQSRLPIGAGDALFLFTDGLVEAEDAAGEPFGLARVQALLRDHAGASVGELLARVDEALRAHRGPREADDDATLVALRVAGPFA